jgi:hypothetical protein
MAEIKHLEYKFKNIFFAGYSVYKYGCAMNCRRQERRGRMKKGMIWERKGRSLICS